MATEREDGPLKRLRKDQPEPKRSAAPTS